VARTLAGRFRGSCAYLARNYERFAQFNVALYQLLLRESEKCCAYGIFARKKECSHAQTHTGRSPCSKMAEAGLLNLHEGNLARYQIRPSEFAAWEAVWKPS
jgi:hypothetical protein